MADRDSEFIREVDEAVRQDQYKKLWDQYGIYALAGALVLVAGVAGYKGWTAWQERKSGEAGAKFTQALTLQEGPDATKAKDIFDQLVKDGPEGYRTLSRFQLASSESQGSDTDKAVADYDALANDPSVDDILRGYATIQAATLRLEKADYAEMDKRLKGLIDSNSAWSLSARELLGLSAYRTNDMRTAEKQFSDLLADQSTPPNLRERADMMLALIVGTPQALSTTAK
ncbi:MAG: tetratricopeptide repeat protein [Actinomycetota bacterium]